MGLGGGAVSAVREEMLYMGRMGAVAWLPRGELGHRAAEP